MNLTFSAEAWDQYLFWHATDTRTLRKINALIRECQRTPFVGTGQPEVLRGNLSGLWSRRIDLKHRLVYRVTPTAIEVLQCRFHYGDK